MSITEKLVKHDFFQEATENGPGSLGHLGSGYFTFANWLEAVENHIYYHCTSAELIPNIMQKGLLPSVKPNWGGTLGGSSLGKVYLSYTPEHAIYYCMIVFRDKLNSEGRASIPVLIRAKNIKNVSQDPDDKESIWTDKIIPPSEIEFFWQGQWKQLSQAGEIDGDLEYVRNDMYGYMDWEGEIFDNIDEVLADVKSFISS